MTDRELIPLQHAAAGKLVFHTGRWGGSAGYRWCDQDGCGVGEVALWESDALDRLQGEGLIAIEHRNGPLERRVRVTEVGRSALSEQRDAPSTVRQTSARPQVCAGQAS